MKNLSEITTYQASVYQSRAYRNLKRQKDRILKAHGLSMMQWALLGLIYDSGVNGTRITDLAAELDSTQAFTTITVSSLEAKGFVKRKASGSDNRVRDVIVNPNRVALVKKIEADVRDVLRKELYGKVSRQELEVYMNVLIKFSK